MKPRLIIACFVLLTPVLLLAGWQLHLANVINTQLAQIESASLPSGGKQLNEWYAAVPDNENAALILTQAFALLHNYPNPESNPLHKFKAPETGERLTKEQIELFTECITSNRMGLEKTDEALKLPSSRYPIDFAMLASTPLPHLASLVDIAKLHQMEALIALETGDTASVATNIETMLALARSLDNEPCLISQLVRLNLINRAFDTLERLASAAPLKAIEIRALSNAFNRTTVSNQVVRALIGERAMTIPYFRMTKTEYARLNPHQDKEQTQTNSPLPCFGPAILRLFGYYELDYGSYLMGMNKGITLLSASPPDNLRSRSYFSRVSEESLKRHRAITGQTFSVYTGVAWREDEGIAKQRIAIATLAVEAFRNDNGKLPYHLKYLTPKYLAEVPLDPFTGTEINFIQRDKGYAIFTKNGKRAEPNSETDAKPADDKKPDNVILTVER